MLFLKIPKHCFGPVIICYFLNLFQSLIIQENCKIRFASWALDQGLINNGVKFTVMKKENKSISFLLVDVFPICNQALVRFSRFDTVYGHADFIKFHELYTFTG